jgi:hypothetical protein
MISIFDIDLPVPGKNEIERRKQIVRELKLKARQNFDNNLPISRENVKALSDYLGKQLLETGCDDSLKFSIKFSAIAKT